MKRSHFSHPPADAVFSPGLRRLAWLNIAVQAAFPLAVAFTPVMAGAGELHFLQQPAPLSAQRTQVYNLGAGETAASVAKKFHLTLDQLRELNQLRTFAHGLSGLQPGDDVDVPLITAKDKKTASGVSTTSPSSDGTSASAEGGDECPSGKAYAYPEGYVPEMLPAVVVFTGAFRVSGYQSYRTQDKKARRAGCNKAGGAPVSWTYYSARRLTQAQCENMLSRDKEVGKGHGFRVMLTEFCCEKVEDDVRVIQQTM
ncbi:DUF1187 family protein [Symbiopectobacterium sp. Eva_TO]